MKYCSIDIETTGLDPSTCQVIEFAAVLEDTDNPKPLNELPQFSTLVRHTLYRGEPYALAMNHEIFAELAKWTTQHADHLPTQGSTPLVTDVSNLMTRFANFLKMNRMEEWIALIVAGKNFANFDNRFLELLPHYRKVKFHHRILDPMMLYLNKQDKVPPGSDECLKRAGIEKPVSHRALDDALMVIQLLRARLV